MMKGIICYEMKKLRDWLDENHIPWKDVSWEPTESNPYYYICRTRFGYNGHLVSVVNGFGTYGGIKTFDEHCKNHGLLEIIVYREDTEMDENLYEDFYPVGYLTADKVIAHLKEEYGEYERGAEIE